MQVLSAQLFGGLTQWASDAVTSGGGLMLAAIMLGENLFPPIPSEAVLPLAGFLVDQGELALAVALFASTAGSVVGALLLYALGRWGGRPVLLRWHHLLRLDEGKLDKADDWFDQRGPKIVFWCRMIPIARSVVSIPAGASEMPLTQFLLFTTAGTLIWNGLLIGAGVLLGRNWEQVSAVASTYTDIILIGIAVAALGLAVWRWRQRSATSASSR